MATNVQVDPAVIIQKLCLRIAVLEQEVAVAEAIIEQLQASTEDGDPE